MQLMKAGVKLLVCNCHHNKLAAIIEAKIQSLCNGVNCKDSCDN